MGRYSLIIKNTDIDEMIIVPFQEYNKNKNIKESKTKVELGTIDSGTLHFKNEEHLLAYFRSKGIVNYPHAHIYVTYQMGGTKYLPIVYSQYRDLLHFAHNGVSTVNEYDYEFQKLVDSLLDNCRKSSYFRFMKDKKYLNKYLIDKITEYLYNPDHVDYSDDDYAFIRSRISANMTGYKVLRGIYIGNVQYYNLDHKPAHDYKSSDCSEIVSTFEEGGYDELYSNYDLDDLVNMPLDIQKKLGLKY